MIKTAWTIILLLSIMLLHGCDFADEKTRDLDVYVIDEECKLHTDAFKDFMEKDISSDINCLELNFTQFLNGVYTGDSGGIRQADLEEFVREYFDGDVEDTVDSLNILFKMNMLFLNDSRYRIKKGNISPIFQVVKLANRYLIEIKKIYDEINDDNALILRDKLDRVLHRFSQSVYMIIKNRHSGPQTPLHINNFLKQIFESFSGEDEDLIEIIYKATPILKTTLLGGIPERIKYPEALRLIMKIPRMIMTAFDGFYLKEEHFQNKNDLYETQLKASKALPALLFSGSRNTDVLFTHDQVIDLAWEVFEEDEDESCDEDEAQTKEDDDEGFEIDVDLLDKLLVTVKPIALGGDHKSYTKAELLKGFQLISNFLELRLFNSLTWDHYEATLTENAPSNGVDKLPTHFYRGIPKKRTDELHEVFNIILRQYRFFKKEGGLQYYIHDYRRNKSSILEISYFRWVLNIIGKPYSVNEDKVLISMETLEQFLWDFKPLLEEFDLWSSHPDTFARNTILLGDLFQYQSDGNLLLNVDEASEYFILVVNAIEVKDAFTEALLTKPCAQSVDPDDPEFTVGCFRKHAGKILFEDLGYGEYMPWLEKYYTQNKEVFKNYLYKVEYFARDNPDDNVPIGNRDMTLILGALLNIESTFIRFDTNRSNIIEPKELYPPAYNVYKQAIIDLVKAQDPETNISGYEKTIFLYLVKKMKIPTKWALVKFHYAPGREKRFRFNSFRVNIGSILYNLIKVGEEQDDD